MAIGSIPQIFNITNLCQGTADISKCPDISVRFLDQLFGQPIAVLVNGAPAVEPTSLVPRFLAHFDYALLGAFLVIYAAMVIIGTLNTAHEGQFLGRQWNSVWTPVRAVIGPIMVVPIKSGFCAIQYFLMYVILVGVGMATYVWGQSVGDISIGYVPTVPASLVTAVNQQLAQAFLYGSVDTILAGKPSHFQGTVNAANQNKYIWSPQNTWPAAVNFMQAFSPSDGMCSQFAGGAIGQQSLALCSAAAQHMMYRKPAGMDNCDPSSPWCTGSGMGQGMSEPETEPGTADPSQHLPALQERFVTGVGTNVTGIAPDFANSTAYYPDPFDWTSPTNQPNDLVSISGHLTYNLGIQAPNNPGKSITPFDLEDWLGSQTGKIPGSSINIKAANIFSTYIGSGGAPTAPCNSNKCSFNYMSSAILTSLVQESSSQLKVCGGAGTSKKDNNISFNLNRVCMPNTGPNPAQDCQDLWPSDPTNTADPKNHNVAVPCVRYTDSWWYGGEVYLSLNQLMSQNLGQLSKDVAALKIAVAGPAYIVKGSDSVKGTTKAFVAEETRRGPTGTWAVADDTQPLVQQLSEATTPTTGGPGNGTTNLTLPSWTATVNFLLFSNTFTKKGAINHSDTWTSDYKGMTKEQHALYNALTGTVLGSNTVLQRPFKILVAIEQILPSINHDQMLKYVQNMVAVLQWNGIIYNPDGAQNDGANLAKNDTLPVKGVLDQIFGGLIGSSYMWIPTTGQSTTMTNNFVNIVNSIYSLSAIKSTGGDAAGSQFDMVQTVQSIGLSIINTIVNSCEDIFSHFKTEIMAGLAVEGATAIAGNAAAIAAAAAPFVTVGAAVATATQTAMQLLAMTQQLHLALQLIYMPLAILVFTLLFAVAVNFAILIPIIPYILFWAGELAWLLGTVEAMIAAPIMMLGLTHPGGNDVVGHIVPGIKMLLGIVFRPVLMVLGLLMAMVLTFIVLKFSAQGFHIVAEGIIPKTSGSGSSLVANADTQGIIACIMLLVFAQFVVMAFNKCYSAIYQVPEKVMQWIGGQAEKVGMEDLQQMTNSVQSTSQQIGQSGGQAMQSSVDGMKQGEKGISDGFSGSADKAGQMTKETKQNAATKQGSTS